MRLLQLALGLSCLIASAVGQNLRLINPPTEIILNDRRHPISVAYSNVNGQADVHIDLLTNNGNQWVGGGVMTINGPSGEVKVPIEVRVPPSYQGTISLRAYIAPVGQTYQGRGQLIDTTVRVSQVPTDAIGVLCQPDIVEPGRVFVINLWYTQTHAKESDIIAVALHADTKQWYGGFSIPINQQQGTISGRFDLHYAPQNAPLKFKAWISPRGEEAPNYVSYTMLNMHLGTYTNPQCYDNGVQGWTPQGLPPANWVELKYVPANIGRGTTARIAIAYNLVSAGKADMDVSLMTWNWDTHEATQIVGTRAVVSSNNNQVVIDLAIPQNAQPGKDGVYVIAYMTGVGGSYDDSYGEDRKYKVKLGDFATTASSATAINNALSKHPREVTTKPATGNQKPIQQQPPRNQQQPNRNNNNNQQQQGAGNVRGATNYGAAFVNNNGNGNNNGNNNNNLRDQYGNTIRQGINTYNNFRENVNEYEDQMQDNLRENVANALEINMNPSPPALRIVRPGTLANLFRNNVAGGGRFNDDEDN